MKTFPIVLISGWGYSSEAMLPLKNMLSGLPVQIASTGELWAQGGACRSCAPQGMSRYAAGLKMLLEKLEGCCVIGWSMGGIVAMETASFFPEKFGKLAVIGGAARFSAGGEIATGVPVQVLRAMAMRLRKAPLETMRDYHSSVLFPRVLGQNCAATLSMNIEELLPGLDYLRHIDLLERICGLTMPVLVIHGREDKILPWQAGEMLFRGLPAGSWICREGAGHGMPFQEPALLAKEICEFLET